MKRAEDPAALEWLTKRTADRPRLRVSALDESDARRRLARIAWERASRPASRSTIGLPSKRPPHEGASVDLLGAAPGLPDLLGLSSPSEFIGADAYRPLDDLDHAPVIARSPVEAGARDDAGRAWVDFLPERPKLPRLDLRGAIMRALEAYRPAPAPDAPPDPTQDPALDRVEPREPAAPRPSAWRRWVDAVPALPKLPTITWRRPAHDPAAAVHELPELLAGPLPDVPPLEQIEIPTLRLLRGLERNASRVPASPGLDLEPSRYVDVPALEIAPAETALPILLRDPLEEPAVEAPRIPLRERLPDLLATGFARATALLVFAVCMTNTFFLRFENFGYYWYRPFLNAYSIGVAGFILSRFVIALFYRAPHDRGLEPTVSIIITAFNEEEAIYRSIAACYAVDYPRWKLEVVVVDDGSADATAAELARAQERWPDLIVESFPENRGKRDAMAAGAKLATGEILLYVDSDSFPRHDAVRNIVQGFGDPRVAAVAGHTDVANAGVNLLTRMQDVRYYVAFRVLKAAESVFGAVTCCPGCFSAYRRSCVLPVLDRWLHQRFLGVRATFGDDRSLTNMLLRRYKVLYSSEAVATTIVPEEHMKFLRQQLRWKKSWLRECLIAATFMWRKHPLAAVAFYAQLAFPIIAPLVLLRAFFWIPLVHGDFASVLLYTYGTTLIGLVFSSYYLFWRIDRGWVFGVYFTLYYMFVLVWQMPYAILTSRDNRWGTR